MNFLNISAEVAGIAVAVYTISRRSVAAYIRRKRKKRKKRARRRRRSRAGADVGSRTR